MSETTLEEKKSKDLKGKTKEEKLLEKIDKPDLSTAEDNLLVGESEIYAQLKLERELNAKQMERHLQYALKQLMNEYIQHKQGAVIELVDPEDQEQFMKSTPNKTEKGIHDGSYTRKLLDNDKQFHVKFEAYCSKYIDPKFITEPTLRESVKKKWVILQTYKQIFADTIKKIMHLKQTAIKYNINLKIEG